MTITCPSCKTEINLGDTSYAQIADQVRNREFQDEIEKFKTSYDKQHIAELEKRLAEQKNELNSEYNTVVQNLKDRIRLLTDFKKTLAVKLIGEDLEQHCKTEFEKYRAMAFQNAYFEKDNDSSPGSKGDFIFRDYTDDGEEYISIMFEMKNESEDSGHKQKNSKFFDKLNRDRISKKCEYAVLVSTLESDNEYYNTGIVEVTGYEKMYVVRPQLFLSIISILRNAARKSADYKKEIRRLNEREADFSRFEQNLEEYKQKVTKEHNKADTTCSSTISELKKIISSLEDMVEELETIQSSIQKANDQTAGLTSKKLTRKAQSIRKLIELSATSNGEPDAEDKIA